MAITTVSQNDATEYRFSSEIQDNLNNLVNDLKALKKQGGNVNLPIQVGSILNESTYEKSTLFPNPAFLLIYLNNKLSEDTNKYDKYRSFIREKLKEVFILQYDDINKFFEFKFKDNLVTFNHPLSKTELGAICTLFPDECVEFLKKLTIETQDWYFNDHSNNKEHRGTKRNFDSNLKIETHDFPHSSYNKYVLGNTESTSSPTSVLSLAGFTFLSHMNFLRETHYTSLYSHQDLFSKWIVDGQDTIIKNIVDTFDEEQTRFYEHFLFERVSNSQSKQFKYLLEKNAILDVPSYLNLSDFKTNNPDVDLKYVSSYQEEANELYLSYLLKIITAIKNFDYSFLEKNLPNFNLTEYQNFLDENPTKYNDFSFFPKNVSLDMIKFLEKFNISPYIENNGKSLFLLPLNLKNSNVTYDYLMYNPKAKKSSYLTSILNSLISNAQEDAGNLLKEEDLDKQFENIFSKLFDFYNNCVLPEVLAGRIKEPKLNFDGYTYSINDRQLVTSFLSVLNKQFSENQIYGIISIFIKKMGDNPKILTGLKDFSKANKINLSDSRLAPSFFNTNFTSSFLTKAKKDLNYDVNGHIDNSVVWWKIENVDRKINNQNHLPIDFNAVNINKQTITDVFLSNVIRNQNILSSYLNTNKVSYQELSNVLIEHNHNASILSLFGKLISQNSEITDPTQNNFIVSNNYSTYNNIPDIVQFINMGIENNFTQSHYEHYREDVFNHLKNQTSDLSAMGSEEFSLKSSLLHMALKTDSSNVFNDYQYVFPQGSSNVFEKFVEKTNWKDILPSLFNSLPNKEEKNRFFKNLAISFAIVDSVSSSDILLEKWAALFENHKNYDIDFELNTSKIVVLSPSDMVQQKETVQEVINLSKSDKKVSHKLSNIFSLSSFEINLFNYLFSKEDSDLKINFDLIPNLYRSSKSQVYSSYQTKLNIAELIDILTLQHIDDSSLNPHSLGQKKKLQEISHLFNKFIYAQELGLKLQDKDQPEILISKRKI